MKLLEEPTDANHFQVHRALRTSGFYVRWQFSQSRSPGHRDYIAVHVGREPWKVFKPFLILFREQQQQVRIFICSQFNGEIGDPTTTMRLQFSSLWDSVRGGEGWRKHKTETVITRAFDYRTVTPAHPRPLRSTHEYILYLRYNRIKGITHPPHPLRTNDMYVYNYSR